MPRAFQGHGKLASLVKVLGSTRNRGDLHLRLHYAWPWHSVASDCHGQNPVGFSIGILLLILQFGPLRTVKERQRRAQTLKKNTKFWRVLTFRRPFWSAHLHRLATQLLPNKFPLQNSHSFKIANGEYDGGNAYDGGASDAEHFTSSSRWD